MNSKTVPDTETVSGESVPDNQPWKKNLRPAWKPGISGNMAGRTVGCRNRLSEKFLSDLLGAYDKHGKAAIECVAVNQPAEFLRIIAKLLPRKAEIEISAAHEINISLEQRRRIAEGWLSSQGDTELSVNG
jgi:hypothetical protein